MYCGRPSKAAKPMKSAVRSTMVTKRRSSASACHRCNAIVASFAPMLRRSLCASVGKSGRFEPATSTASPPKPIGAAATRI